MKVLLDENVPHPLRPFLARYETFTALYVGFAGLKNGALLRAAAAEGFDVLVTADKTIQYEQNLADWKIAIVSLSANSWRLVRHHTDRIAFAVGQATPGSFTRVDCGDFQRSARHLE